MPDLFTFCGRRGGCQNKVSKKRNSFEVFEVADNKAVNVN